MRHTHTVEKFFDTENDNPNHSVQYNHKYKCIDNAYRRRMTEAVHKCSINDELIDLSTCHSALSSRCNDIQPKAREKGEKKFSLTLYQ